MTFSLPPPGLAGNASDPAGVEQRGGPVTPALIGRPDYWPNITFARSDPADVARRLRALVVRHGLARRQLLGKASDVIRIADALAWLADDAYRLANRLADAAGDHGAVIGRLRLDCHHLEADAERIAERPRTVEDA